MNIPMNVITSITTNIPADAITSIITRKAQIKRHDEICRQVSPTLKKIFKLKFSYVKILVNWSNHKVY